MWGLRSGADAPFSKVVDDWCNFAISYFLPIPNQRWEATLLKNRGWNRSFISRFQLKYK
jgi:hypothetical protein